jgi:hypothetical protein
MCSTGTKALKWTWAQSVVGTDRRAGYGHSALSTKEREIVWDVCNREGKRSGMHFRKELRCENWEVT